MGCCLIDKEPTNELILTNKDCTSNGLSVSRIRDMKIKSSLMSNSNHIKSPMIKTLPISKVNKVKLSLKSIIVHPYLRKYSMMNTAILVKHNSSTCIKPLGIVLNESNMNDNDDNNYQSDDEPLKKRASLHISKFMFVFQDDLIKKCNKTNKSNKTKSNKAHCLKKKKPIKPFHSPYEDEYDLAVIHFKSPGIPHERTN